MRVVQYRLLSRVLEQIKLPDYIHGFEKDHSIPKMAVQHVGKRTVISLDIQDFFPSIKQYMLVDLLKAYGMGTAPAITIAELCTYTFYVPQGSLTAPKLSNLISATTFGPEIKKYCDERGITMTIYADDITMSYSKDFENLTQRREFAKEVIETAVSIINKYGFRVNRQKTKVMGRNTRQWVCGAVVNEKVNMMKAERNKLRAIIHNVGKNGIVKEAEKTGISPESFIRKYAGRINWLCQLNMDAGSIMKRQFRKYAGEYLRKLPEHIEIPELAWNSGIELKMDDVEFEREVGKQDAMTEALSNTTFS